MNYNNELNGLKETIEKISLKLIHENLMFKLFTTYTYETINTVFENLEGYLTNEQKSLIIISKETKLLDITIQKMTLSGSNAIVFLDNI